MKTVTSDKTMRDTVVRELDWDPMLDADRIGVSAKDGAIVLSGHVPAYPDKWAAVRAAERVYGVRAVADEIEVKLSGSSVRDDADIAEEITRVMSWSAAVPSAVKAEARKGHVTLRGEVEWGYQRNEAKRAIRYLGGVRDVTNLITIKPHAPKPADVEDRVGEAIERMADLDARSVWVTTSNGTVHLHGHVHSLAERRIAERAAASAPGVANVDNDIFVTP
jgi:osmotically-inducible protein OsmY